MAISTSKVILFSTSRHDRKVFQHPVAVFNNPKDAKTFVTFLKLARRSNDVEAVKSLDPEVKLHEDGTLMEDTKYSLAEVRYAPQALPDDDDDDVETPATT